MINPIRFIYIPAFVGLLGSGGILGFALILYHNERIKSKLREWRESVILVMDWLFYALLDWCMGPHEIIPREEVEDYETRD